MLRVAIIESDTRSMMIVLIVVWPFNLTTRDDDAKGAPGNVSFDYHSQSIAGWSRGG